MIKFFRNIRKQLAAENNVAKYLRYAMGEIILVVIGILIAVQINSWNRERLNSTKAEIYKKFLLRDLEIESKNIHDFKNFEASIKKAGIAGLTKIKNKNLKQVFETIKGLPSRKTLVIPRSTYDDLISTGNIALFVDQDLRDAIINHYQKLEYTREVIEKNNSHFVDGIIFPGFSTLEMQQLTDPDMMRFYNKDDLDFIKNINNLSPDYPNTKEEEKIKKRKAANLIHMRLSLATIAESLARQALEDTKKLKTILTNH